MAESIIQPLDAEDLLYRYSRRNWRMAGIDNFTLPPGEDEDNFEILNNILPPMNNVLQRRFGYATFVPKLDTGVAAGSDQIPSTALFGAGFDGESGYVSTAKSYTYNYTPVFSVEFWFETLSNKGGYFVSLEEQAIYGASETQLFGIYITAAGKIGVGYDNSSAIQLSATTPLSYNDGLGHHVVVTVNGATILIYVDNVLVVTSTVTPGSGTHAAFWRLAEGAGQGNATWPAIPQFLQTFLSHVSVFNNVVLTATQVGTHYTAMTSLTGTQSLYESAVSADNPTFFWYLTDVLGMPPASESVLVQSQNVDWIASSSGTQSVTMPFPVGINHIILLAVSNEFGNIASIADNQGNSYTSINGASHTGYNNHGLQTFYTETTSAGTLTITFTNNAGASGNQQALIHELQNVVVPNPIDGSNIGFGQSVNMSSNTINTADEPDIVFSFCGPNGVATLVPAQGFVLGATDTAINSRDGKTMTFASAYRQTTALGSFSCNWTQTGSSVWLANIIGLQLNLPTANTNGNTAFDSADTNTGTYQLLLIPNSISTPAWTGSGTASVSMVATATAPGIAAGDTGFLLIEAAPSTLTITGVTDSNGNTWVQQSPTGLAVGTAHIVSVWTAPQTADIATGSTLTITATLSANCSSITGSFFNVPDIAALQSSAHATGTSTAPSSGGITTTTATAAFSIAAASATLTGYPGTPWSGTPFLVVTGTSAYAVDLATSATPGTFIDIWALGSSVAWAVQDLAFLTTPGYFLGEFIVVI